MSNLSRRSFITATATTATALVGAGALATGVAAQAEEAPAAPVAVDGTYSATYAGFGGDVTVTLTISDGSIASLEIVGDAETPDRGGKAIEALPEQIVTANGLDGVEAWSGATVTSNAIFRCVEDCLAQAGIGGVAAEVMMKPGVYVGEGNGFNWIEPIRVKIEVDETSLLSVEVIDKDLNREEPLIMKAAEDRMIPRMIENQSVTVDSICGATSSSNGIKMATEDALKKALAAGGSAPEAIKAFYVDPVYNDGAQETIDVDVLVCGLGGAGCAAAMSAAEAQVAAGQAVSVLAIETAGKWGGTAANAGEPFSVNAPRYLEEFNGGEPWCEYDSLYEDWMATYSVGTPCKPEMVKLLMDESGNTVDWLQFDHGFVFTRGMKGFGTATWLCKQQYVFATNKEEDIDYEALYPDYDLTKDRSTCVGYYYDHIMSDFQAAGGQVMLETTVTELIFNENKTQVIGAKAVSNVDHTEYVINAKAVICCTGGFGGNTDLEVEWLKNPEYPMDQPWNLWGMRQNKGQVLKSAIDQGMGTYNLDMPPIIHFKTTDSIITEFPVYYRDGKDTRMLEQNCWSLNDIPMLIGCDSKTLQVGQDGLRHYNEAGTFAFWAGGPVWYTIVGSDRIDDLAENGFAGEPGTYQGGIANVYNQGGFPNARPIPQIYEVMEAAIEKGYVFKADTLEELAEKCGMPAADFVAQVERFKGFCEAGEDAEFGRNPEGLLDQVNYGPYYAVKCNPVPYATHAALDVNEDIKVLLPDGTPVIGLYACGNDSGGVLESNLLPYAQYGGVALGWAFTSGRLAGANAVEEIAAIA